MWAAPGPDESVHQRHESRGRPDRSPRSIAAGSGDPASLCRRALGARCVDRQPLSARAGPGVGADGLRAGPGPGSRSNSGTRRESSAVRIASGRTRACTAVGEEARPMALADIQRILTQILTSPEIRERLRAEAESLTDA